MRLIAIQVFVYIMHVCTVYIHYVCINTHTCSIYFEYLHVYAFIYSYSYILYITIFNI